MSLPTQVSSGTHSEVTIADIHEPDKTVFVLWGEHFMESTAVNTTVALRKRGVRVKLVGLQGRAARGAHGLTLSADLTLGEALPLAERASCVVLPCAAGLLAQADNDPRVGTFVRECCAVGATVLVECEGEVPAWLVGCRVVRDSSQIFR